jgi:hypothetical protein
MYICLMLFVHQQSLYRVVSSEGDIYVGLFEQISDEGGFFPSVCEISPLWFLDYISLL